MSISGIGNLGINRTTTQLPVRDNTRTQGQGAPAGVAMPQRPLAPTIGTKTTQAGMQAEAPVGTDPALWSVLSGEERAFFAKAGAMGPLTYGRAFSQMKNAQMPANRGGRLDIKI